MKKVILYIIISIFLLSVAAFFVHQYFYYRNFNNIEKELIQNNSVDSFEMHTGNYDIEIEEIYADLYLDDGNEIRFTNLYYPNSFHDTSYVQITQLNGWGFETNSFRESTLDYYILGSLQFGKHGQLNNYVERNIFNVAEAIDNRSEIYLLVEQIPEYPKMAVIRHLDWHNRPTTTFISKYRLEEKPSWSHDKFENRFDSLLSVSTKLKTAYNTVYSK
ncbi:MAG: hypothetical protein COA58_15955 [Bacteroidetes bacterium]|nr:MAG: hypothetical protein COA58_15955 [Bacteroidota bacterium]